MGFCSPHPQTSLQGSPCENYLRVYATRTRRHCCRKVPARTICGSTRPAPAETFLCEESFTKSTPKTSWFLDFQRKGQAPFETPLPRKLLQRRNHLLPEVVDAKPDICLLAEQTGGENFACEVPEGMCPSEENPKRKLPLWHAFDYFPRERKVIAGAGRVDPQYSCRKFGEGNKVSFSYPHHQKCNCAESPSAGLGCVSP